MINGVNHADGFLRGPVYPLPFEGVPEAFVQTSQEKLASLLASGQLPGNRWEAGSFGEAESL